MTRTQALNIVAHSHKSARETAAAVTLAQPRYLVYNMQGLLSASTDRIDYALSARMQVCGTVVDRYNWK